VEEENISFTAADSKKRKTGDETEGGISKKQKTEDVVLVG
jgi:hypothetical protein